MKTLPTLKLNPFCEWDVLRVWPSGSPPQAGPYVHASGPPDVPCGAPLYYASAVFVHTACSSCTDLEARLVAASKLKRWRGEKKMPAWQRVSSSSRPLHDLWRSVFFFRSCNHKLLYSSFKTRSCLHRQVCS